MPLRRAIRKLYLCADGEALEKFCKAPASYLKSPPSLDKTSSHIAVLGAPLSGRVPLAAALAKRHGMQCVSLQTLPSLLAGRAGAAGTRLAEAFEAAAGAPPASLVAESIALLAGVPPPTPTAEASAAATAALVALLAAPPPRWRRATPLEDTPPLGPAQAVYASASTNTDLSAKLLDAVGYARKAAILEAFAFLTTATAADEAPLTVGDDGAVAVGALVGALSGLYASGHKPARSEPPASPFSALNSLKALLPGSESASAASAPQALVLDGLPSDATMLAALKSAGVAPARGVVLGDESAKDALLAKLASMLEAADGAVHLEKAMTPDGAALDEASLGAAIDAHIAALPDLRAGFLSAGVELKVLPIDTPANIASAAIDPFTPTAVAIDPIDDVTALAPFGKGSLGATGTYCPGSLIGFGRLVKGKPELAVSIQERTYLCASEEMRAAVLADPSGHIASLDGVSPPPPPPPPLFIVAGPPGCGKADQCARLADSRKLPVLTLRTLLDENPVPPPPPKPVPQEGEEGEELAEPEEEVEIRTVHTAEEVVGHIATALKAAPFGGVGCILDWADNVLLDAAMWETLAAAKLIPDALIALEQGDDDAVKRLFKAAARPTAKLAEKAVRLQKRRICSLRRQAPRRTQKLESTRCSSRRRMRRR